MTGSLIGRAEPIDAAKILKFIRAAHVRHGDRSPAWIDRFALLWVTDVVCRGVVVNATVEGRVVGSIGLALESFPWNPYVQHLRGQWLHVLDNFVDSEVRDALISAAMGAAVEQEAELEIDVPDYLWRQEDKALTPMGAKYFFGLTYDAEK